MSDLDPVNWEVAKQVAMAVAGAGVEELTLEADGNSFESIVRAAEMALDRAGALPRGTDLVQVRVLNRGEWAGEAIDGLKPLIAQLAGRLGSVGTGMGGAFMLGAPQGQVPAELQDAVRAITQPLAPIFMGFQMGLVVGFVTTRARSQYDLCLPRAAGSTASFILRNIDDLAEEAGVARDEMRLWVAMHEVAHHSEFALGWTSRRLADLLTAYIGSITFNADALQEQLSRIDPQNVESMQQFVDNPDGLLGQFIDTSQPDVLESVHTFMSVLEGYVDHVVAVAAEGMLRDSGEIASALRRRAEESPGADRMLESLLGLQLTDERIAEGRRFCEVVTAAESLPALNRMWESIETLPTQEEISRPQEWIERMRTTPTGGRFALDDS